VLLSTHILPEVSMTCSRVMIIDYGRIIAEDTADGLTQRVRGSNETRVRVAGPRAEVLAVLRLAPGVDDLREEPLEDGAVTAVVRSVRGDELRRELAATIVGRGWGLLEMRSLPMSLEDLFVRLVREERDAAA